MEFFVILVNNWKPLANVTKTSILDTAGVLDTLLTPFYQNSFQWLLVHFLPILSINVNYIFWTKLLYLKSGVCIFLKPFFTNVPPMWKPSSWCLLAKCHSSTSVLVHFASKNELLGFSVSETLVGNGLNISFNSFIHKFEKWRNIFLKILYFEHRKFSKVCFKSIFKVFFHTTKKKG